MADIIGMLDELQNKAIRNSKLRERLLATKNDPSPVSAFCRVCREEGYEIYEMELICAGEDFHAAMKRSTNGGGENSPMLSGQDDFYELFLAAIDDKQKGSTGR